MQTLIIDKEFQSLIPPLTQDEYAELRTSILNEGCRDALVVWNDIIVDGHNRYQICQKYNVPFQTVQRHFDSRNDVIMWMIHNQLARRNLPVYERARLALRLKPVIAGMAKEHQGTRNDICQKSDKSIDTKKELAKAAGVSHDTIAKVEKIEAKATPEVKQKLSSGEMSINQAYNAVKLEEKKQQIIEAERAVHEEAEDIYKPVLYIGDSIGYTPSEPYDLLLTDPPYSTDVPDIASFAQKWLYNALNHVKPTGFAYVFIGAYPDEIKAYLNAPVPDHMKLCQQLVWTYRNTLGQNPKDRYKLNYQVCLFYRGVDAPDLNIDLTSEQWAVQDINAPDGRQGDRYHAWQKPMELAERFIRHSTKPGMTVFDPFACTGTFLLAATKLGRKAYGFELNEENAAIAVTRGCVQL